MYFFTLDFANCCRRSSTSAGNELIPVVKSFYRLLVVIGLPVVILKTIGKAKLNVYFFKIFQNTRGYFGIEKRFGIRHRKNLGTKVEGIPFVGILIVKRDFDHGAVCKSDSLAAQVDQGHGEKIKQILFAVFGNARIFLQLFAVAGFANNKLNKIQCNCFANAYLLKVCRRRFRLRRLFRLFVLGFFLGRHIRGGSGRIVLLRRGRIAPSAAGGQGKRHDHRKQQRKKFFHSIDLHFFNLSERRRDCIIVIHRKQYSACIVSPSEICFQMIFFLGKIRQNTEKPAQNNSFIPVFLSIFLFKLY